MTQPPEERPQPAPASRPGLGGAISRMPIAARIVLLALVTGTVVGGILLMRRGDGVTQSETGEQAGALDSREPMTGEAAPDFALANLEGETVRLSSLRGRPVVINFWATWCGPCRREMPDIQEAYAGANGEFVVLAVNSEGTATSLAARLSRDFRDEFGLTFPILLDSPDNDVFNQYRLRGLPDTFFIDRDGIIREAVIGPLTRRTLDEKLQSILK